MANRKTSNQQRKRPECHTPDLTITLEQFSPYITLSNADIQALTCLSRTELTNAQKWLSDNKVIEYKFDGFPRVKYFRINYKTLATLSQQVLAL